MKIKYPSNMNCHLVRCWQLFLVLSLLVLTMADATAANLFWDAGNTNNGVVIDPGSGAWDTDITTNLNWNNGTGNVSWKQTSTTTGLAGAIFQGPDALPGTYQVAIDGGQVAATNLVVNASGYMFSGNQIYLNANLGVLPVLMVSNGVNVIFSNNLTGPSLTGPNANADLRAGDSGPPASVTIAGAITGYQMNFTSTNGSIFYLANPTGTASGSGTAHVNADVRMINGTYNSAGAFVIGRVRGAAGSSQPNNSTGVFTLDGPNTIFNHTSDYISIGRDSTWNSTLIIQNGATLNYQPGTHNNNVGLGIPRPGSSGANNQSWVKILGGTLNMGPGNDAAASPRTILIANGGSRPGENSILTQSGGVINAWGGIQFGSGAGTYDGGTAALTNSGGFLYIGAYNGDGLKAVTPLPPTNYITFSGGTVGALQSWHSSANLPITLDTLNGNITFQCADSGATPFNITLDQTLRGPGGFNKTGSGQLTLNSTNTYAGSTVVSNGTLNLTTASIASSNGPVTLDGSAGSPNLVLHVANQGQYWSVGTMTFASGTPQIDFQFGQSISPSKTTAAIHVNGNLDFTVTPTVVITNAGSVPAGTYPLIAYSGSSSGTAPTVPFLPISGCINGYLTNDPTARLFELVITQSCFNPPYVWSVNSSNWDFSSKVWTQAGTPGSLIWADGNAATFDDTAPNVLPGFTNIVITLNTTVAPGDMAFNNLTNAFTIVGTGSINIALGGNLELQGGGTVTLATTNTYSGGTVIHPGSRLNVNSGGSVSGSPVGTGTLTLDANARLGNSSGSAVALQYPVSQAWNGSFTYVGNNDLDLGLGAVTLAQSVTVNVVTNNLVIEGNISDNGNAYQLSKTGNGTLTLAGANSWNGLELFAGQVNLNSSGAAGSGSVAFSGGTVVVDNTSGADVALTAGGYNMQSATVVTFIGTTNLDLGGAGGTIDANGGGITFNFLNNVLRTGGIQSGNSLITKTGNGTWVLGGADLVNNAIVTVNQGELDLARDGGNPAIGTGGGGSNGGAHGLVVNSNSLAKITGSTGNQISHAVGGSSYVEVILNTGILDLNGQSQGVDMISMTNGVLRNSVAGTGSLLAITGTSGTHPTNAITLTGTNCQFDIPSADAALEVNAMVNGGGTLVKTGLGTLTLDQSNSYTGNITVRAGILNLPYPDIASRAVVSIGSNAVLNLNFPNSDTNIVAALILNGTNAPGGFHNSTTDPLFITGNGSLFVNPINPLPGTIQVSLSGNTLNLAWPTNAGWLLQAQTNSLQQGLGTNWVTVPGSDSLTNLSVPIGPTNGAVFYRMIH